MNQEVLNTSSQSIVTIIINWLPAIFIIMCAVVIVLVVKYLKKLRADINVIKKFVEDKYKSDSKK